MRLAGDENQAIRACFGDAPYVSKDVVVAMASLGFAPTAAAVLVAGQSDGADGVLAWRVAWIGSNEIGYVEAPDVPADAPRTTGWVKRLSDVRCCELVSVARGAVTEDGGAWHPRWKVTFADGVDLTLPLFGEEVPNYMVAETEQFFSTLRSSWLRT